MPWVKIDDGFHDHPKIKLIGLDGAGLLVSLTTWSSRHLTDGVVPEQVIRDMCGHHRRFNTLLTRLIKAGCLRKCPGGTTKKYRIHDYLEYNDSADVVKARRAAEREKKRRQRLAAQGLGPDGRPLGTTRDADRLSRPPDPSLPFPQQQQVESSSDDPPFGLDPAAAAVVEKLKAKGVDEPTAVELVVWDVGECSRQLAWIHQRNSTRNGAGLLVRAIRERFEKPTTSEPPRRELEDYTGSGRAS